MKHRNLESQGLVRAAAFAALLAALAAVAACGDDTNPFPPTDCCVANVYYVCHDASSASACLSDPPLATGCVAQGTACPTGGAAQPPAAR